MAPHSDDDESLVMRAGNGDRAAAAMLIERHTDKIYKVSFRMLGNIAAAEDATQDTFLKMWRGASNWKPKGAKFETWLYRVAMNVCIDQLRRRKREAPEEAAPEQIDGAPRPDESLWIAEREVAVEAAMATLPVRQRMAISLCHFEEFSNIEAAAILETSVDAVESLLARARRKLRKHLLPQQDDLIGGVRDEIAKE